MDRVRVTPAAGGCEPTVVGVTTAISEQPVSWQRYRSRLGRPAAVAAVLALAELAWFTVELLRGYFWQDDFTFLYLGATEPLGAELLLRDYNGHLQPGAFLLSWLVARLAPLNHAVAVLPVVAMHGLALVLCWWLLVRLFGERWAILVPFTMVAFSPLSFALSTWWAYALQLLPVQLALLGALHAHATYLQRPTRLRAAQGFLFVALGLAFWEKALLIPPLLFALTLVLADGDLRARLAGAAGRHRRLWLGYAGALAAYLVIHVVLARADQDSRTPNAGDLARLAAELVADGLLPAIYGGPWSGNWVGLRGLAPQLPFALALAWALTIVVVIVALRSSGLRAVLALSAVVGHLVASVLLVAFTRLGEWAAIIGTDPRYIADALPVAAVFGALALIRPLTPISPPLETTQPAGARAAAVPLALVAALVIGSSVSIASAVPQLRHESARSYVENVRAAVTLYPELVVYDTPVPQDMLLALLGDYAYVSRVLGPLQLRVDQPTDDLRMFDSTGNLRQIGLVDTVRATPGPVPDCGYLVDRQSVRVPLTAPVHGARRVLHIDYYTTVESSGTIATPGRQFDVRFEPGLHRLYVVADGPIEEVLMYATSGVCITDVIAGAPLPQPG